MKYDFDEVIPRMGTNSNKWEYFPVSGVRGKSDAADPARGEDQILPMWVADMDFRCAQPIIDAMTARVQHGIFGYTFAGDSYYQAVTDWYHRRHGWRAEADWIVSISGVVPAINMLVRAIIEPGDKVIIQPPVYHPFHDLGKNNGGEIVYNPLIERNGRYEMDFEDLTAKAADPKATVLVLCNPHNPAGMCWSEADLRRLYEICGNNGVKVISDEIHCDLILPGKTFTSVGKLGEEIFRNTVICTAPSKTFSLAGLHLSSIVIPDPDLRARYSKVLAGTGLSSINPMSLVALETAYREGEDWLNQALDYVAANYAFTADYVASNLPKLKLMEPDGTYMVWVDFRGLGMDDKTLSQFISERVKLALNDGYTFGPGGSGFERMNLACPRSILERALDRLKREIDRLEIQ